MLPRAWNTPAASTALPRCGARHDPSHRRHTGGLKRTPTPKRCPNISRGTYCAPLFVLDGETIHHTLTVENPMGAAALWHRMPRLALPLTTATTEDYEIPLWRAGVPALCVSAIPNTAC